MRALFTWLRNNVRDAILGGIGDAERAVSDQINGYAESPPLALPFLSQPVQALPRPEAVPVPVAVPEVAQPSPLDVKAQALALRAEGKPDWEIGRKLKIGSADDVKQLLQ